MPHREDTASPFAGFKQLLGTESLLTALSVVTPAAAWRLASDSSTGAVGSSSARASGNPPVRTPILEASIPGPPTIVGQVRAELDICVDRARDDIIKDRYEVPGGNLSWRLGHSSTRRPL